MPGFVQQTLMAACRVQTDGTALVARNCTTARNGAGDYTVTLPAAFGVDANEAVFSLCIQTADRYGVVINTSDIAKQVLTYNNAGAATDAAFSLTIAQIAYGAA